MSPVGPSGQFSMSVMAIFRRQPTASGFAAPLRSVTGRDLNYLMRKWHVGLKARIGIVISKLLAKNLESEISSAMGRSDSPYPQVMFHQFREIHDVLPVIGKQMIAACYKINVRSYKLLRDSYYFLNFGVRTTRHDYDSLLGL